MDPRTIPDMPVGRIKAALAQHEEIPRAVLSALRADRRATVRALAEPSRTPRRAKSVDMLSFERKLWRDGVRLIAGVDEAGRGPLAGPVCAAAVILPVDAELPGVTDSKALTHEARETLVPKIEEHAVSIGVQLIDHEHIDRINIFQAAMLSMREAIAQLDPVPEHVLVDGNFAPGSQYAETAIVKGDAHSLSVAAASIVAKVTRDRLMVEYDTEYPVYGFAQHKGYATPQHLAALREHGPCPIHRRSYSVVGECEGVRSPAYWLLKDAIDATRSEEELREVGIAIRDQRKRITEADRDLLAQYYRRKRVEHERRRASGSRRSDSPRYDDVPPPEDEPFIGGEP